MTWTPSEGQKRTDALLLKLRGEAHLVGMAVENLSSPMLQARLFDEIAKAIDLALEDGAEHKFLADDAPTTPKASNGHAPRDTPTPMQFFEPSRPLTAHGYAPLDYTPPPPTADPVGFLDVEAERGKTFSATSRARFLRPAELNVEGVPVSDSVQAAVDYIGEPVLDTSTPFDASKKKRGRPPGSKAKKPKAKRRSAKAIRAELYPVEAPSIEAGPAAGSADAPAAEAA